VAYTLYMLALTYLVIASPITLGSPDLLMSAERYMLAAAPMFLLLGRWMGHRPWLDMLLVSGGLFLMGGWWRTPRGPKRAKHTGADGRRLRY
jgi:hypothetical protein